MQEVRNALMARVRVGSVLTTRKGTSYRVIEPVVQVAPGGSCVPALMIEVTAPGRSPQSALVTVGILIKLMRGGGRHKPGAGAPIDWARVERRTMTKESTFLRGRARVR